MAASESAVDPLTEFDNLTSELVSLEKQFAGRKVPKEEFELLSKQLKERILKAESQAYAIARKDGTLAKRLRIRNYNDPEIQQVINHFVRSPGNAVEPEFGTDRFPRYPVETGKEKVSVERPLLQRMADIGMLTEKLFERILYCPHCGTPSNVYLRFKCTQCGSIDISINRMIEHLQCGTIHQESAFRVGKNLICPTCKKLLQATEEYRLIGVVCSCNACRAHFEDPNQSFYCRKCRIDFDLPTATVVDVFAYSMSKEALNEALQYLGVNALTEILTAGGFAVKSPGVLTGPTKEVAFSLLGQKDTRIVAIDLFQNYPEVDVEPVLTLYVKMLETNPTVAVFAAIPRLSRRARDVASLHNILVAEGESAVEVGQKVLEIAQRM